MFRFHVNIDYFLGNLVGEAYEKTLHNTCVF